MRYSFRYGIQRALTSSARVRGRGFKDQPVRKPSRRDDVSLQTRDFLSAMFESYAVGLRGAYGADAVEVDTVTRYKRRCWPVRVIGPGIGILVPKPW